MGYWAKSRKAELTDAERQRIPAEIADWQVAYWQLQHNLTRDHIIPFLAEHDALPTTGRILEVGASEAGCLAALMSATGLEVHGVELAADRCTVATGINGVLAPGPMSLYCGDITRADTLGDLKPPYSLIILRDVIEHIEAPYLDTALANLRDLLADDGAIYFSFPPYFSPFGAHQQVLSPSLLKLPWLQLLPFFIPLVSALGRHPADNEEIASIRRAACTIGGLSSALARTSFELAHQTSYLIRPVFKYRYGLQPVVAPALIGRTPLRELFVTASWMLARKK